ncbi:nuclear envelope pore membrane protein POM 121 isoform X2 [Sphaeramia orbicularis]|uniref:nuclear envelope pore membrane protein POM 121 isoform X2 n=1 Tax=Sphaeramia orbicularis TaxID=375764 RepID=UPI00117EE0E8|nr:nuclear envelope pore membrane protein POM 121-like isoform X2 [Sphaeramia orbicularis]
MRVLRRRVAAMSPKEKHLALLFLVGFATLTIYCFPTFLYAALILAGFYIVSYYRRRGPISVQLGLGPRAGLNVQTVLQRWIWGLGVNSVSEAQQRRTRVTGNKTKIQETEGPFKPRFTEPAVYRREALASDSFLFSPRDFLMGSYIGKPESPNCGTVRPNTGRNYREELREKLSRPNHAVYTPNRRLSFTGESLGSTGRFSIAPQRHYPLQQGGFSSVGVLPPVRWNGFRQKNILSPRNTAAVSPVTVKIARPDHSTPSFDHLSFLELPQAEADPCSRESVLKVLKESRKREVEDEDRSFTSEQKSKRRRNDSGGSTQSAFEPLLPNGTSSQLVPKPGSLKRGMTSVAEETTMKRSRTSSISSGSGVHTSRGISGTRRNPIYSSYSSSQGLSQVKKPSAPSPPLSSPGSSRSQTPEGVSKRPREDEGQSPSSASSVRSDLTTSDKLSAILKPTAVPKAPATTSTDSTNSGGKRKRKIQLVSSHRDDQLSLPPPPPELGYSITVQDLDEEKRAAISKIQKVLETPAPQPEDVSPPASTSSQSSSTSSTTTLNSLLTAPLPKASSSGIPVINLDPIPTTSTGTTPAPSNPLLESLKMKSSIPTAFTSAATTATVSATSTPAELCSSLKTSAPENPPVLPPSSQCQAPSAFTQVLGQVSKTSSNTTTSVTGSSLFGLPNQSTSIASSSLNTITGATAPSSSSESVSNTNPLLVSGFKPIFAVTTTSATTVAESKPQVQSFKPIFGIPTESSAFGKSPSVTVSNSAPTVTSTSSVFGSTSTTAAQSDVPVLTNTSTLTVSTSSVATTQPTVQPGAESVFGNWSTPSTTSTSSTSVQVPTTGSAFQFGTGTTTSGSGASSVNTTTSTNSTFTFGVTQSTASQNLFTFGQAVPSQNTTSASLGGFGLSSTVSTTATSTQSTFSFGKSLFEVSPAPSTFGSTTAAPPKPFTFGGAGASSTPISNPAPFTFGTPATTASTFGTPAKPVFGTGSGNFTFGGTTVPQAAPSFGAPTQTQSSSSTTFPFTSTVSQQPPPANSQSANTGFNFGASISCPQFGGLVQNNSAPQMGSFKFGAAGTTDKPVFGTSTPSFGQSTAAGPISFGSPGTPVQGFTAAPFGSPATPSFSIGAGSKPSAARQRLQARRQHNRKK